ncbi:hypothetical protein CAEBREN_07726 [Caenorhabditis brenneri]|uniref:G-protein coupled receptors family 1 profile domain-containing protein n=1 Tax=Caenorhabditis brenneri TaxID=135651 RepID=G0N9X6_CAEBE|nr:hypothetical protein CAEBREN_07726 [Caenorhabditis brenneri]
MLLENWSDTVSVYWDFTLGPVTFIANIMLIIIILKYTPESTKAYSSIILSITIADCASLIGNFMSSARVLPRDSQIFMIFRGACTYCFTSDIELKSKFCLYWYASQIHFYLLNHMTLIFSYIYRVIIITNPMKKLDNRKPVYIGLVSYSTLHLCYFNWVCYKAFQPMDTINQAISKYEPDIVGSGATYNGIVDLREPSQVGVLRPNTWTNSFTHRNYDVCGNKSRRSIDSHNNLLGKSDVQTNGSHVFCQSNCNIFIYFPISEGSSKMVTYSRACCCE